MVEGKQGGPTATYKAQEVRVKFFFCKLLLLYWDDLFKK